MELWIRNQNKETLELTTYLQIIYLEELDQKNKWVIEGGSYLGYYNTKERALEVLDEIQSTLLVAGVDFIEVQQLKIEIRSKFASNSKTGIAIYEMPEN